MSVFDDVYKFMELAHPDKISSTPRIPPEEVDKLCWNLIEEEVNKELKKARDDQDPVEIADALADSIWVLICMGFCYGIPMEKVWNEVARTNMAKFPNGVVIRRPEDGKILKPPGWKPPEIARILDEARLLAADNPRTGEET